MFVCLTRPKEEDNPRLGGAVFRREAVLPATPTPPRGAYSLAPSVRTPPLGAYRTLVKLVKFLNFLNNILLRSLTCYSLGVVPYPLITLRYAPTAVGMHVPIDIYIYVIFYW